MCGFDFGFNALNYTATSIPAPEPLLSSFLSAQAEGTEDPWAQWAAFGNLKTIEEGARERLEATVTRADPKIREGEGKPFS